MDDNEVVERKDRPFTPTEVAKARQNLVEAIEACFSPVCSDVGELAIRLLGKNLNNTTRPIVLSYADIAAFDQKILHEYSLVHGSRDRERAKNPNLSQEQEADYNERFSEIHNLHEALSKALEVGVLITQDNARGRIAGA